MAVEVFSVYFSILYPSSLIITISPDLIFLINSAPTISNAHVSLAKMYAPFFVFPKIKGRNSNGSTAPYNSVWVWTKNENPPFTWRNASFNWLKKSFSLLLLIKCTNTSVSDEEWKIAPYFSNSLFNVLALIKFPLCAKAILPSKNWNKNGWILRPLLLPEVAYRTCPIALFPSRRLNILSSLNTSDTSPGPRCPFTRFPSLTTIPAASCPRCCKLCNP